MGYDDFKAKLKAAGTAPSDSVAALNTTIDSTAAEMPESMSVAEMAQFKKKKRDDEQKAIDFYLTKPEQKQAIEKKTTAFQDILDFVDNINRVFYGVTAGAKAGIEDYQQGKSAKETLSDIGSGVVRGLKREERTYSRDIAKLIAPEMMQKIEEKTSFNVLGIDGLQADAATLPFFAADILADPLTYVPFGLPLELAGDAIKGTGKGLKAVAAGVIGADKVEAAVKGAKNLYIEKIGKYFDKKALWKDQGVEHLYDMVKTAGEKAEGKSWRVAQDISRVADKNGVLSKTRWMTDEEAQQISKMGYEANDEAVEVLGERYAKALGTNVEHYAKAREADALTDEIVELTSKTALTNEDRLALKAAQNNLTTMLKDTQGGVSRAVTQQILEKKGFKKLANKLADAEKTATQEFAKARFGVADKIYKESDAFIKSELDNIQKIMKSDTKVVSKMVGTDVQSMIDLVKITDNQLQAVFKGEAPGVAKNIQSTFAQLKERVANLNKYQLEVTKGVQSGAFRSEAPLRTINALIKNLEIDTARQTIGVLGMSEAKLQAKVGKTMNDLQQALKEYKNLKVNELDSIGPKLKMGSDLQNEVINTFQKRLKVLVQQKADIDKFYNAEKVLKDVSLVKAEKFAPKISKKYYDNFNSLTKGGLGQKVLKNFEAEKTAIFEKHLSQLPEELHPAARAIRGILDSYGEKLTKGANPIVKGVSPLYWPRVIQKEFIEDISNAIPMFRGGAYKGFTKSRKFGTAAEWKAYAEKQGAKIEDDAIILTMDYIKNAEKSYAKHVVQNELMAKYGVTKAEDIPKNMKESLFYLYSGGATRFNNPFFEKAATVYGDILNKVKASLTVINPAFHGRNILGFPFLAMTTAGMKAGLNPKNYTDGLLTMLGKEGSVVGKGGERFSYKAIREAAEASGYFGSSFTRGDLKTSAKGVLGRYSWTNPKRYMGEFMKFTTMSEDLGRYGTLIANLKSGKPMEEALSSARKAMFDYNLVNSPMDKALQGMFGFYVWNRKNLPRQIMTVLSDPKQYSILSRTLYKISNREDVTDEEMQLLNQFDRESFKIFGQAIDGVREFSTLGFFPVEQAYQTLNSIRAMDPKRFLAQNINPLATTFMDWYYSKDSFYQSDFGNKLPARYTAVIPEQMQKVLKLTKRTVPKYRGGEQVGTEEVLYGDPDVIFMIRKFPPTARLGNELTTLNETMTAGKTAKALLQFTTGIKNKELDIEKQKKLKALKERKILRKEALKKGAGKLDLIYVPKTQKPPKEKDVLKERLKALQGNE